MKILSIVNHSFPIQILFRASAIIVAITSQVIFFQVRSKSGRTSSNLSDPFQEIPNKLAIGGLVLVSLAVVVQGFKKVDFNWRKWVKI